MKALLTIAFCSCGNVGKLQRVASALPRAAFAAFPGKADVFLPALVCGGAGLIGALVNVAPKAHVRLLKSWREGRMEEAVRLQALLVSQRASRSALF